jgi:hypothetical protein
MHAAAAALHALDAGLSWGRKRGEGWVGKVCVCGGVPAVGAKDACVEEVAQAGHN